MSDVKQLIDQYASENAALRQQVTYVATLLKEAVYLNQNDKGEVRIPGKDKKKAEKFGLEVKQLKTSTVLKLMELEE